VEKSAILTVAAASKLRTPLFALHTELGGRMVDFAGFDLPVQFPAGIMAEHLHTRRAASLFDVSHMGQLKLRAKSDTADLAYADPAAALETLAPGDIVGLAPGRMRYTLLTNEDGGILDDLMVTRLDGSTLYLVVNAACKQADLAHLRQHLGPTVEIDHLEDRALLALQGPKAAEAMALLAPGALRLSFLGAGEMAVAGIDAIVTRSGYTGEDGFEISVPANRAEELARRLLAIPYVKPAGLGARDSLRLDAGLCLYGYDIDRTTSLVEAGLGWTVGKRRLIVGDFPGYARVAREFAAGTSRMRVGIALEGRLPARAHAPIYSAIAVGAGAKVGEVTSGGFSPTLDAPIAMGYVPPALAGIGTALQLEVRGKMLAGTVTPLPFVAHRYFKG
jgi:aminomethyltransferase